MKDMRIRFKKSGRAKYISHLDLTRTMTRALRRAGVPVWYTEGFNKHPYLTFASPLSLGFEGDCESMDIRLVGDMPENELVERLNGALPEGLEVVSAAPPVMKPGEIAFARYRLTFTGSIDSMSDYISQPSITAEKRTKSGVTKSIELKPYLEGVNIEINDDSAVFEVTLPCGSAENINPMLIADAYNLYLSSVGQQERKVFCDVQRLDIMNRDGKSFE
jgi:radical SAM-linked protein